MISALEAFSRSLLKTIVPNLVREIVARLLLSVLVLLYFSGALSFDQFVIGSIVTYLICLLILISYLWQQGEISIQTNFKSLDQNKFAELIKYSLLSFAGMAGMILIGKVDSMMVSAILGLASNAIYTTAFYMATVIEIPKRALSQITMPLISKAFEQNEMKEVASLYRKTSINQFIIGSLLLIGLWINLDNIFTLMPKGDNFELGKWVVIIIGFGKMMDMLFGPSSEIIVLSKYYQFNIVLIIILASMVIIANNILIPRYGIEGAAWGSAFALIIFNLIKFIFIYIKFGIQPFAWATLKVLVIGGLTIAINTLLFKFENTLIDLTFRSTVVTLVFTSLVIWSQASTDANSIITKLISVFRKRN